MNARSGLVAALLIPVFVSANAVTPHRWRTYRPDPDFKITACYPADLLHTNRIDKINGYIDLSGKDGAGVLFNARPDKYTTIKDELRYSLAQSFGGPMWVHDVAPDPTTVRFVNAPRLKIDSSVVRSDMYLYIAENHQDVVIDWAIHIDHAIKSMMIHYLTSQAARWKGVPEHMRACFKSFGRITNPNIY